VHPYWDGWWNAPAKPAPSLQRRTIDADDVLGYATIGDPGALAYSDIPTQPIRSSPGETRIAVVVRRGDLAHGRTCGALIIYDTHQRQTVTPALVVEVASSGNFQPIANIRWVSEERLLFEATSGADPSQIFSLDVRSASVKQLSSNRQQPFSMQANDSGTVAVSLIPRPEAPKQCGPVACRIDTDDLFEAETGGTIAAADFSASATVFEVDSQVGRTLPPLESMDRGVEMCPYYKPSVSPDGRHMLQLCRMKSWPKWWSDYTTPANAQASANLLKGVSDDALQWYVVDLRSGQARALLGTIAPAWAYAAALPVWIDEGKRVVLPGALVPLSGLSAADREFAASGQYCVVVEVETGKIERAIRLPRGLDIVTVARLALDRDLLEERGLRADWSAGPHVRIHLGDGTVEVLPAEGEIFDNGDRFWIRQSLNERPVLVDRVTGRTVLDPNRWLDAIKLGRVEPLSYDVNGLRWSATVYFPSNFDKDKIYPMVIQTHANDWGAFSLSGAARHFAAQPLAARQMIVLQLADTLAVNSLENTPAVWGAVLDGYEQGIAAVKKLAYVDDQRIGLVGWSRTGPYVSYVLTHSSRTFAAAAVMDEREPEIANFLQAGSDRSFMSAGFGSLPLGAGLKSWLEKSAIFNLERIRTPVLMWVGRTEPIRDMWDLYVGLRVVSVPVEFWRFPDGNHELSKVTELHQATGLLVDWMSWWLQGSKDADPNKNDQYRRWDAMTMQQAHLMRGPRPPLLEWQPQSDPVQH
jgi:hypothetical protein